MAVVRILSYNVRSLRDDRQTLYRLIRGPSPDIVVLQEAPRFFRWRSKCAELARRCGLIYVAGGRNAGDNLLLAAVRAPADPARVVARRVPRAPMRPIAGVVGAVFDVNGARLGVVGAHLGLTATERAVEVAEAIDVATSMGTTHTVVAGDLNELPGGQSWRELDRAGFRDLAPDIDDPTFPSTAAYKRIDAILGSSEVKALEYGVPVRYRDDAGAAADYARASDHLPVLAVVDVPDLGSPGEGNAP